MKRGNSDLVDIEVYVHHKTDAAALISATGKESDAAWIPLSRMELEPDRKRGSWFVATMPEALAINKGLV